MAKILTPIKAIRAYCVECSGDNLKEVRYCTIKRCPPYPYRMGKSPKKDILPNEQQKIKKSLDSPAISAK